jgi:hypothetical protein
MAVRSSIFTDVSDRFVKVMTCYMVMSDEELGLNMFTEVDDNGGHVVFKGNSVTVEEIGPGRRTDLLRTSDCVRGIAYHRAKRTGSMGWESVVKFFG